MPSTLTPDKLLLLQTTPLFADMPRDRLETTLSTSQIVKLTKGEYLLVPGQAVEHIYVVLSGRLGVQADEADTPPMTMLGQGDSLGEMSILGDEQASTFVVAATDCELLAVELSAIWATIEYSHKAALNLLRALSMQTRIDDSNQDTEDSLEQENGYKGFDMTDKVTGLYNRHWMSRELKRYLQRCARDRRQSCMIVLEIDEFQKYIGKFGALGGDQALRTFAQTVTSCQRPEDQAGHFTASQFIVFLPYTTDISSACIAAERLRSAISKADVVLPNGDLLPRITVSLGVSQLREDGLHGLLSRAEASLREAKKSGGNCVKSV